MRLRNPLFHADLLALTFSAVVLIVAGLPYRKAEGATDSQAVVRPASGVETRQPPDAPGHAATPMPESAGDVFLPAQSEGVLSGNVSFSITPRSLTRMERTESFRDFDQLGYTKVEAPKPGWAVWALEFDIEGEFSPQPGLMSRRFSPRMGPDP